MTPNPHFKRRPLLGVEYIRNNAMLLQTTNRKWCGLLNCAVANDLDLPSRSFHRSCLKISVAYFFPVSGRNSRRYNERWHCEWPWIWPLKVISGAVNDFIICISKMQHIQCTKSITTVGRHMWAIISNIAFDRKGVMWCSARPTLCSQKNMWPHSDHIFDDKLK